MCRGESAADIAACRTLSLVAGLGLVQRVVMSNKRKRPQVPAVVTSKYFGAGPSTFFHTAAPRKGSLPALLGAAPHTLFMGTQASDNAIDGEVPFFTNENAFWHIIGDALGFRRGFHIGGRSDAPDFVRRHLIEP